MKVNMQPEKSSRGQTSRRSEWMLVASAVAALPLVLGACGSDTKSTATKGGDGGANTVDPGTNPGTTNPNATIPDSTTAPTSTSIAVVVDVPNTVTAAPSSKAGTYAMITSDGKKLIVTSYDYCAWINAHNPGSVSEAGDGAGLILDIDAMQPVAGMPYTVNPISQGTPPATYDANVVATYRPVASSNICDITSRGAVSGSVTWSSVSATQISGSIKADVLSYDTSKTSTVNGPFVATKCTTTSTITDPFTSDPQACHGQSGDDPAKQGLTYF